MSENRNAKRWETRRAKYGPRGHLRAYNCQPTVNGDGLARLVAYVNANGLLSEGQLSALLITDRLTVRTLCDMGRRSVVVAGIRGVWGKRASERMADPEQA